MVFLVKYTNLIFYTNEFTSGFSFLCRLSSWTGRGDGDLVEEDEQGEVGSHSQSSISRSLGLMSCSQPACLTQLSLQFYNYFCPVLYFANSQIYSILKIICQAMQSNMLQLTVRIELFVTDDTYSKCKKSNRNYIPYDHKCLLIAFTDKFRNVTFDE